MRVLLKFAAMCLVSALIHCVLLHWANEIDESAFVLRVLVSRIQGMDPGDPRLVEDAERLLQRQCARDIEKWEQRQRHQEEQDVALASAAGV